MISLLLLTELSNGQAGIKDNIYYDYPLIYKIINSQASKKYPDNYAKRKYVVREQCDACYYILYPSESIQNLRKEIPIDVWTKVWTNAFTKFSKKDPKNAPCDSIEGNTKRFDCMYSYAIVDWVLVKFDIIEQVNAYKKSH